MKNTMEILSEQLVKDAIVGAIEGGSNYWYYIPQISMDSVRFMATKEDFPCFSEALGEAVYKGGDIIIRDLEDTNEILGTLSKDSINTGLYRMVSEGRNELNDMRSGNDDAETHDVLFQYFVMGEIVFG